MTVSERCSASFQQLIENGYTPNSSLEEEYYKTDLHYTVYSIDGFKRCPLYSDLIDGEDYHTFTSEIKGRAHDIIIGIPQRKDASNNNLIVSSNERIFKDEFEQFISKDKEVDIEYNLTYFAVPRSESNKMQTSEDTHDKICNPDDFLNQISTSTTTTNSFSRLTSTSVVSTRTTPTTIARPFAGGVHTATPITVFFPAECQNGLFKTSFSNLTSACQTSTSNLIPTMFPKMTAVSLANSEPNSPALQNQMRVIQNNYPTPASGDIFSPFKISTSFTNSMATAVSPNISAAFVPTGYPDTAETSKTPSYGNISQNLVTPNVEIPGLNSSCLQRPLSHGEISNAVYPTCSSISSSTEINLSTTVPNMESNPRLKSSASAAYSNPTTDVAQEQHPQTLSNLISDDFTTPAMSPSLLFDDPMSAEEMLEELVPFQHSTIFEDVISSHIQSTFPTNEISAEPSEPVGSTNQNLTFTDDDVVSSGMVPMSFSNPVSMGVSTSGPNPTLFQNPTSMEGISSGSDPPCCSSIYEEEVLLTNFSNVISTTSSFDVSVVNGIQDLKYDLNCLNSTNHHKEYPIPIDQDGDTNLSTALQNEEFDKALDDIRTVREKLCSKCFSKYLNNVNKNQKAPIHFATHLQNEPVATELLRNGTKITIQDNKSNTIFHIIVKQAGNEDEALRFLKLFFKDGLHYTTDHYKEALDKRNNDGKAPIHLAYKVRYKEVIRFMVEHGAYVNKKDTYDRRTCVVKAARDKDWDMVIFLQGIGACINEPPASNVRAIHHACEQNNLESVKFLISHGAELNQRTSEGKTEKQLTNSEEIKTYISKELCRRRNERSKSKQKGKQRPCKCGGRYQLMGDV